MEKEENKINARIVAEIRGHLDSPLLVGSGEDERTDMDQLMTADGIPFIPGSSLAGVLRSYLEACVGRDEVEDLFGTLGWSQIPEGERENKRHEYQSRIFVYDTLLTDAVMVQRDGVRLDEGKTSEENKRFDMQAVETGAFCRLRLEILVRDQQVQGDLEEAIKRDLEKVQCFVRGMETGGLLFGARRNRGFGKFEVQGVKYRTFRLNNADDYKRWLDWHWDDDGAFAQKEKWKLADLKQIKNADEHLLCVPLEIKTTLLIRSYAIPSWGKGRAAGTDGSVEADCGQLALGDGTAVIPGSTWSGAIRGYVADLARQIAGLETWEQAQKLLEPFWGTWATGEQREQRESLRAAKIRIEETRIAGGHSLPVQRNSVNRFTGGAATGALFTETLWAGGTAMLNIRWSDKNLGDQEREALIGMLLWAIQGLRSGLLAVGGEGGVGRGIFGPAGDICLDGESVEDEETYLRAAAQWCRRQKEATKWGESAI